MAKSTLVRFLANFFDAGEVKFAAGEHYPVTEETQRQIAAGNAELVEIDISAEKAQSLAVKARAAADRAAAAAAEAEALAAAAVEAQKQADDALAALEATAPASAPVQTPAPDTAAPVPGLIQQALNAVGLGGSNDTDTSAQ